MLLDVATGPIVLTFVGVIVAGVAAIVLTVIAAKLIIKAVRNKKMQNVAPSDEDEKENL